VQDITNVISELLSVKSCFKFCVTLTLIYVSINTVALLFYTLFLLIFTLHALGGDLELCDVMKYSNVYVHNGDTSCSYCGIM